MRKTTNSKMPHHKSETDSDRQKRNAFPAPGHNHDKCLAGAIDKARQLFAAQKLKLTPLREEIYRQVLNAHTALGAYEIRDQINRTNRNVAPITIYRILDLLRETGLIHRLESQNTYYACYQEHKSSTSIVTLICQHCGNVAELVDENVEKLMGLLEKNADFVMENRVLEIEGKCPQCRKFVKTK